MILLIHQRTPFQRFDNSLPNFASTMHEINPFMMLSKFSFTMRSKLEYNGAKLFVLVINIISELLQLLFLTRTIII